MNNSDSSLVYENPYSIHYKGWDDFGTLIARVDESASYEVDITEIWKKDDIYYLLTASGCSCWSGEYETREFKSLQELSDSIRGEDSDKYMYNPSYRGLTLLMEQAQINDR